MKMRNTCVIGTLKFDNMVNIFLSEEARKTSGSALSVDWRGRSGNRDKKKNERSKFKLGICTSKSRSVGFNGAVRWGIFRRTVSKRMEKVKAKRKILCISKRVMDLTP